MRKCHLCPVNMYVQITDADSSSSVSQSLTAQSALTSCAELLPCLADCLARLGLGEERWVEVLKTLAFCQEQPLCSLLQRTVNTTQPHSRRTVTTQPQSTQPQSTYCQHTTTNTRCNAVKQYALTDSSLTDILMVQPPRVCF